MAHVGTCKARSDGHYAFPVLALDLHVRARLMHLPPRKCAMRQAVLPMLQSVQALDFPDEGVATSRLLGVSDSARRFVSLKGARGVGLH